MRHSALTVFVAIGLFLSACGGAAPPAPAPASASAAPKTSAPPAVSAAAKASSAVTYKPAPLNPPVKVNTGGNGSIGDVGVYVGIDRGYFKDEGLEINHTVLPGSAQVLQAIATNQVAISLTTPDPALFNAMARGVNITIIAESTKNSSSDKVAALMVRQDWIDSGKVKGPADLKGATIAVPSSSSQFFVERYLARGKLTANDVTFKTLPLPDQLPALSNKSIDAGWEVEPLVTTAGQQGLAKPIAFTGELLDNNLGGVQIANPDFAKQNREVVSHWVVAYLRGMRDYYHLLYKKEGDADPVIQALIARTALKDPKMYSVIGLSGADPNMALDLKTWDEFQDYFIKQGQQQQKADLAKYVDRAYVENALNLLGRDPR